MGKSSVKTWVRERDWERVWVCVWKRERVGGEEEREYTKYALNELLKPNKNTRSLSYWLQNILMSKIFSPRSPSTMLEEPQRPETLLALRPVAPSHLPLLQAKFFSPRKNLLITCLNAFNCAATFKSRCIPPAVFEVLLTLCFVLFRCYLIFQVQQFL